MLINEAEREIVFTLIEQVVTHNFEKVYKGRENFDRWYWNEKKNLSLVSDAKCGVSKGVFFCNELPEIVIKTPIMDDADYCKKELDNYMKAEDEGFENYFAEIEYFGEYGGIPFYIQIAADNELARSSLWNSVKAEVVISGLCSADSSDDEKTEVADDFLYDLSDEDRIDIFFGGVSIEFLNFLMRNEINDLHEGNIGVIGERKVIFDYSGW